MIRVLFAIGVLSYNVQIQEYANDTYVCADDGRVGACMSLTSFDVTSEYDCGPTGCAEVRND
jgi:hypothetical protein